MKLLRLHLFEPYRSLEPFEQTFPKPDFITDEIDPICLVGLNGSGKSNFLELLADIFYYLDTEFLKYSVSPKPYTAFANNKQKAEIYFEIDYTIKVSNQLHSVRISRSKNSKSKDNLTFFLKKDGAEFVRISKERFKQFLPKIVAYTSGSNDLLSMPFIELQDYYAREVTYRVNQKKKTLQTPLREEKIAAPNLMLMDYDSNAAIIIANFLLNDTSKIQIFEAPLRIKGLDSFRIFIRLNKGANTPKIDLPNEFEEYINKLTRCATCYHIETNDTKGNVYTLDYLVNDFTKKLFKTEFGSAQNLFTTLYKLNLLNTFSIQKEYRNSLRKKRENGILLKFPTVATLDKIFSIDQLELVLSKPKVRTEYMKISDGEHQFIHIVGGILLFDEQNAEQEIMYLLDEPDTHFNPQWRSKFFNQLEHRITNKNQEIILTTHSPFILSDCHGYNVFKFKRDESDLKSKFSRIEYETYGSSFSNILKTAFEFETLISEKSLEDLRTLHDTIDRNEDIGLAKKRVKMFGESVERLYLLKELDEKTKKKK